MAITDYEKYMPEANGKGKLANYQDYSADTKAAGEVIPFGAGVQLGPDGETVLTIKSSGNKPYGIALAQEVHDWVTKANDQSYPQFDPVAVIRKGVIWVEAGEDVITGEAANINPSNGKFYASDTATSGTIVFPTATFKSKAAAGSLVQVEINLP
ncbi:structural cement protein Gp24 [Peribacillus sp. B-H-3]|uniref:structural cement protein Gp24 n=1 Tax=Peribacillus sp. B-H-3 TaxID=3400420 RepID=UPI003B0192DD